MAGYRIENRALLLAHLLGHPCVDCGETDPVLLDFDHRDPASKRKEVGRLAATKPWPQVLAEIAKCDVRCANCHRRRTARQFAWGKLTRLVTQIPQQPEVAGAQVIAVLKSSRSSHRSAEPGHVDAVPAVKRNRSISSLSRTSSAARDRRSAARVSEPTRANTIDVTGPRISSARRGDARANANIAVSWSSTTLRPTPVC